MKKWRVSLVIVSLLAVSSLIIYKEALARPRLCDTMEQMCTDCNGDWDLWYCEPWDMNGNGLIDCEFCCYGIVNPQWPCEWPSGTLCGRCVL
jgi:hypothetical protein